MIYLLVILKQSLLTNIEKYSYGHKDLISLTHRNKMSSKLKQSGKSLLSLFFLWSLKWDSFIWQPRGSRLWKYSPYDTQSLRERRPESSFQQRWTVATGGLQRLSVHIQNLPSCFVLSLCVERIGRGHTFTHTTPIGTFLRGVFLVT